MTIRCGGVSIPTRAFVLPSRSCTSISQNKFCRPPAEVHEERPLPRTIPIVEQRGRNANTGHRLAAHSPPLQWNLLGHGDEFRRRLLALVGSGRHALARRHDLRCAGREFVISGIWKAARSGAIPINRCDVPSVVTPGVSRRTKRSSGAEAGRARLLRKSSSPQKTTPKSGA